MSTELPGTPRAGKYCPRCHAMTQREEAVCRQCGHRFRTGAGTPAGAQATPDPDPVNQPDPMNRTMQFVLPPLPPRSASPAAPPRFRRAPRRLLLAAAALAVLLCLAGAWLRATRRAEAARDLSPVGRWETTLHGKSAANAHLEFQFAPGGAGRFSWRESGPGARSGKTPLRWHENADGTLGLALTAPPGGDPISQTLAGIFSRPAWPWRVDRVQRRLVLGTLALTEKP